MTSDGSQVHGCCSICTLIVLDVPAAATPTRLVATPGSETGAKLTVPSKADVATEVWLASSCGCTQRPRAEHGGDQA